jgi:signal transduction histidine kinase
VRLTVTDTGHGMDQATQARVFEPFFTTKDVGEGTGLGLSVSYGIVQDHGGWISATSSRGAPTVFEVNLPAFRGPESLLPGPPRESNKGRMPAAGARA